MKKLLLIAGCGLLFLAGFGTGVVTDKIKRFKANWTVSFSSPCILSFRRNFVDLEHPLERLLEVAHKPGSPILYDRQTCEFEILHVIETDGGISTGAYPMAYCPFTGRPLGSGRGFLFAQACDEEVNRLWAFVKDAECTNDIIAILGKPDMSFAETEYSKAYYTYTNLSGTADMGIIIEHDGRFSPIVYGKQIRQSVMKKDSNKHTGGDVQ